MSALTEHVNGKDLVDTVKDKVSTQTEQLVAGLQDFTDSHELPKVSDVAQELAEKARAAAGLSTPTPRWFGIRRRWVLLGIAATSAGVAVWWVRKRREEPSSGEAFRDQLGPQHAAGQPPSDDQKAKQSKEDTVQHDDASDKDEQPNEPGNDEHLTGQAPDQERLDESTGPLSQRAHDEQSAYPSNDQPAVDVGDELTDANVRIGQAEREDGEAAP
jgi:hypothetical protein